MLIIKYFTVLVWLSLFTISDTHAEEHTSASISNNQQALVNLGLNANCIAEPIFNGKACLYEANPSAEQTIVFIHGLNASANSWHQQIARFKSTYHVLAIDLPGFGQSSRGNHLYSPTNYARLLKFISNQFINKPFYLVGHSMGGAVALRYSAMYPNDVKRLVIADVGGIIHQYSYAKSFTFKWIKLFDLISYWAGFDIETMPFMHKLAKEFFSNLDWLPLDIRDALSNPELRKLILQGNALTIAGAAVSSEDFTSAIWHNKIPTLVVWGLYDLITPIRTANILVSRLQNARLKILTRSAHSPMTDQADQFNQLLLTHLTDSDNNLNSQRWHFRRYETSNRIGRCFNERGKIFKGNYQRIEIMNCKNVFIDNVNAESLVAQHSDITINDSQFKTQNIAIALLNTSLELTSTNIFAGVAIQMQDSHIDVAGVNFNVSHATVNNFGQSDAVFSASNSNGRILHLYKDLTEKGKY